MCKRSILAKIKSEISFASDLQFFQLQDENDNNNNNNNNNNIQIGKRQLHFIRLNHVLLDLNRLSKNTVFMFTFTPFPSVKLTASKNF